jgi:sugar phosphate isomerase/epimerase
MYLTGFADEAASDIDGQIRATKELGWSNIEARGINGKNLHDITDADFEIVCEKLAAANIHVNCYGSAIANGAKSIEQPIDITLAEAQRAIPRMLRLGTKLIRIMSYPILKNRAPEDQFAEERFRRLRTLQKMFSDSGLQLVHENCWNFGAMSWKHSLVLLEKVPGLKLVFDTGNPVESDDYSQPVPRPKQSSWSFYTNVREHVAYVHIKDGRLDDQGRIVWTFPGEGNGDVKRVVKDLLDRGYDGGFSMEPHMKVVAHDPSVTAEADARMANYVEYGRRFMRLVEDVGYRSRLAGVNAAAASK